MRGKIEQGLVERLMILRATVSFKNNLAARLETSRELNRRLDEIKKEYLKAAHNGQMLPPLDPQKEISR